MGRGRTQINWRVINAAKLEIARRMIRAAEAVVKEARRRMGTPYPPASRRNQYPRRRTGRGIGSIDYSPKTPGGVVRAGRIRIFHAPQGWYMEFLADARGRRGLRDVARSMSGNVATIIKTPSGVGTGRVKESR